MTFYKITYVHFIPTAKTIGFCSYAARPLIIIIGKTTKTIGFCSYAARPLIRKTAKTIGFCSFAARPLKRG